MGVQLFVKVDPAAGERRWSAVTWGPTLFGAWAVTYAWGRLGTDWSQRQAREFDVEEDAVVEAEAQIRRRLSRGYRAMG